MKPLITLNQILINTGYLARHLVADCSSMVVRHQGVIGKAMQCAVLWAILLAYVYRQEMKEKVSPRVEKTISELKELVEEVVKSQPVRPVSYTSRQKRSRLSAHYVCDSMDEFDEQFSEDMSLADQDHESTITDCWDCRSQTTHESSEQCAEDTLKRSIVDPGALVGWKVALDGREDTSQVLGIIRRPLQTTRYLVQHSSGGTAVVRLKRGRKKGMDFVMLEKAAYQ